VVYADSACTNYEVEDHLLEAYGVALMPSRRSNSRRKDHPSLAFIKECRRKVAETAISGIKALSIRKLHAVTIRGWLLKITLLIFAFTLNRIL